MNKYRVEKDLTIYTDRPEYKIIVFVEPFDLWLTYSNQRYKSEEEANKAIKKLK